MVHRVIGQEQLALVTKPSARSSLDEMAALLDWSPVADLLKPIYAGEKGEAAWPPLAMFKALLLAVWYDLSDVKLAEALDDRASFRRFCGFSSSEPTPERTAFVRFRRALVAAGLDRVLFEAITAQLRAKAVRVETGTIVDATIIASASTEDEDGRWVKHKNRPAVHGFKAHVAADADTALVEEVAVTPANVNDGKAGSDALPCEVGEVFADSAYRGGAFGDAVRAKGGVPRIAATACGAVTKPRHWARGVQRGDPARAGPHREDLRHLETQLRPATPAMAGSCQGRRPSSLHRHCL